MISKYSQINRNYSSLNEPHNNNDNHNNQNNKNELKPIKKYNNFKQDRVSILKECNDISGVYYLINNINGHAYVGSSINLSSRMRNYHNTSFLKSKQNINMPIIKALLKYGHSNFLNFRTCWS